MFLFSVVRSIADVVLEAARRRLPPERQEALDRVTDSLRDAGMTSLALVALIGDLEQSFDVVFPSEAIDEKTFQSAETVAAALARIGATPRT